MTVLHDLWQHYFGGGWLTEAEEREKEMRKTEEYEALEKFVYEAWIAKFAKDFGMTPEKVKELAQAGMLKQLWLEDERLHE